MATPWKKSRSMDGPLINQGAGRRLVEILASMVLSALAWEDEQREGRSGKKEVRPDRLTGKTEPIHYTSVETTAGDGDDNT